MTVWVLGPRAAETTAELRARLRVVLTVASTTTRRAAGTGTGIGGTAAGPRSAALAGGGGPASSPAAGPAEQEPSQPLGGCDERPDGRGLGRCFSPSATGEAGCVEQPHPAPAGPTTSPVGIPGIALHRAEGNAGSTISAGPRYVLLDLGRGPIDARHLADAAADVGPNGVLAVTTVSHHECGRLHDPRPGLIAAATAAGLAHLQHIVTITRSETDRAAWVLGPDLSLFQTPAAAVGAPHHHTAKETP